MADPSFAIGGGVGIRASVYYKETESAGGGSLWEGFVNPYVDLQLRFSNGGSLGIGYHFMGILPIKSENTDATQVDHLLVLRGTIDFPIRKNFFVSLSLGPVMSLRDFRSSSQSTVNIGSGVFSSVGFYLKTNQRLFFGINGNMIFDISAAIQDTENLAVALLQRSSISIGTIILIGPDY